MTSPLSEIRNAESVIGQTRSPTSARDSERPHPATERAHVGGLDDEMHVIPLEGAVDQTEVLASAALAEGWLDHGDDARLAQRRRSIL